MSRPKTLPKLPEFDPVELDLHGEDVPIKRWVDGTYRVGDSRVLVYLVAQGLHDGMTAEDLKRELTSLDLEEMRAVERFYHRHKDEVDEFARIIEHQGDEIMAVINAYQNGER